MGISIEAAIDRYAWNDDFALTVSKIRESSPEAFSGAEIVDAGNAWIAFKGAVPEASREMIDGFGNIYSRISVSMRTDMGFTEMELQMGIEAVHYALYERPEVRYAVTSHDYATRKITTLVVLEDTASDALLNELQLFAEKTLIDATRGNILDSILISVVRSPVPVPAGGDSSTRHLGGEAISGCTSGFVVTNSTGHTRGILTAGHCGDSQSDDGSSLTFQAQHIGTHGDFQWHTGSQDKPDDFYSGDTSSTEVNQLDVVGQGLPVVGQSLCRNGSTSYKDCQEVRKLNVCGAYGACNLVQMGARLAAGGDSGGPVFWGSTVYGIHQGWVYDPWPFDRDVFSLIDRVDEALGMFLATS
ncbi:MAG: S1 family peptidase [Chloroflexi bacterium]|nr:S1 family peptidase [Chloroflexota bacterium]